MKALQNQSIDIVKIVNPDNPLERSCTLLGNDDEVAKEKFLQFIDSVERLNYDWTSNYTLKPRLERYFWKHSDDFYISERGDVEKVTNYMWNTILRSAKADEYSKIHTFYYCNGVGYDDAFWAYVMSTLWGSENNPFESGAELWRSGYIVTFTGSKWQLRNNKNLVIMETVAKD